MMRGGDKAAFGVLFDRYYDLLHTFARHIIKDSSVAEDIIQNVFVKMWMRKEQVNPELSVRNYLLVATRNELFDYMRLRYNMLRSDINDASSTSPMAIRTFTTTWTCANGSGSSTR